MNFEIGDIIYKKKYHGNKLLADYKANFIILNLYNIPIHNGCNMVVALLDDNTEFEIMVENTVYVEKMSRSIFCCC
jgi:hypothetical protein